MGAARNLARSALRCVAPICLGTMALCAVPRATVNVDELPVHSSASAESDAVGSLKRGDGVTVGLVISGGDGEWCEITHPGPPRLSGFVPCGQLNREPLEERSYSISSSSNGTPAARPAPKSDVPTDVHLKAIQFVEASGVRDRLVASIPVTVEQMKAKMQKQFPDFNPAFFTEFGKRYAARVNPDDFVNVAVRAYEERFTSDELTQVLTAARSRQTGKPIALSPALQKKLLDLQPAIMGEITGGCTEIGAKLGQQIGAEIEKEHPEYVRPKPQSATP